MMFKLNSEVSRFARNLLRDAGLVFLVLACLSFPVMSQEEAESDPEIALAKQQAMVAERFAKLEALLLRRSEIESAENPTRAALLQQAARLGKERDLADLLAKAAESLKQEQLSEAIEQQKTSSEFMQQLLELLQSENREKRIREDRDKVRRWIEDTNRLLRMQGSLRGRTEGGQDASQASQDQGKLEDKASQIAQDLGGEKESEEKSGSDPGEQEQPANPDAKDGSQSQDGANDDEGSKKNGADGSDGAESKSDAEQSPSGDDKNEADPSEEKQSESVEEQGENKSDADDKSDTDGDQKNDEPEGKPSRDQNQEGQQSQNSESDPQQGSPEQEGQQSQDSSQSQQSQGQQSEGQQSQDQQSQQSQPQRPQTPAQKARQKIQQAQRSMERAREALEDAEDDEEKRKEAIEQQLKAEENLRAAVEELKQILRQLREEEIERSLASLEERLRRMLDMQNKVLDESQRLREISGEGTPNRQVEIRASNLAKEELKIRNEGERAFLLLREEGSSAAFPEAMVQLNEDIEDVVGRLQQGKVDKLTIAIEEEVVLALEEMINALVQVQKENEKKKQQQQQMPGQGGQMQQGEQPLVDRLAELRLILTLQTRINKRTDILSRMLEDPSDVVGQVESEELLNALKTLSERQSKIQGVTRNIADDAAQQ